MLRMGGSRAPVCRASSTQPRHTRAASVSHIVPCDAQLFPMLIGKGGANKRRLEEQSGARLYFNSAHPNTNAPSPYTASSQGSLGGDDCNSPCQSSTEDNVVVEAGSEAVALAGKQLVCEDIAQLRQSRILPYNFFVSLPLVYPALTQSLQELQAGIMQLEGAAAAGLEPSLFTRPERMHLTVVPLKLYSDQQRRHALQVLDECGQQLRELLGEAPLEVQLVGLASMRSVPVEAMHVMYLKVKEVQLPGRLLQLFNLVTKAMLHAGLLLPEDDRKPIIHATVMNTRYRADPGGEVGDSAARSTRRSLNVKRKPVNGTGLMAAFGDWDAGVIRLGEMHMSHMESRDPVTGYYVCAARHPLS
ncbi:AKAP7 2'5' RNA ligase-like domain-containing protein [Haematococcus lacustris]